jgi:phage terminase small subunit
MPRKSAEEQSAAAFRAGAIRRSPPPHLSAPAKRLWTAITNDRPVDYFRPGSFEQLSRYCELTIEARKQLVALRKAGPEDYPAKSKVVKDLESVLATLGRQLRLTPQAEFGRSIGRLNERGDGATDTVPDPLLGGKAVWGQTRQ